MESKIDSKSQPKQDYKLQPKLETFKSISTTKNKGKFQESKLQYERGEKKKKYKRKKKKLTQQQIEVFRQAFEIFDYNKSGSIDEEELASLMSALGYECTQQKIRKILEQVDEDGSGVIELDEFVQFMSKHMLDTDNLKKQITKVFTFFDDDNSGYLDFRKIKTMVNECFFNIDDEAIKNMIKVADIEGDGKINKYEFLRIMKKIKLL